ncbi:hypothetical protein [Azospirillum melinis]
MARCGTMARGAIGRPRTTCPCVPVAVDGRAPPVATIGKAEK